MECMTLKSIFKHMFNFGLIGLLSMPAMAEIIVKDGFVRAMPPSSPNTAAYFTLENHGPSTELIAVETNIAKEAQLHTLLTENDIVKMRQVEGFDLPSHGTLKLGEQGDHVMLLGLASPLAEGNMVTLLLKFKDGQTLEIKLPVAKAGNAQADEHHHHHH
ncbi:copper chaperone PCu(A)C [Shewanella zhangzhouensis]|uniref:copper chaperone PCu(A)C n=1 Tax=Shewanella zhangzhouensis TaxID=2864213 RepID=UPI001C655BA1|nr:copper chaperone PCu(A)C [Shewanella zhangzhouensis]QYK04678.1 copper chaperone PCu(A)C [Shewanella zhangzhouensis]